MSEIYRLTSVQPSTILYRRTGIVHTTALKKYTGCTCDPTRLGPAQQTSSARLPVGAAWLWDTIWIFLFASADPPSSSSFMGSKTSHPAAASTMVSEEQVIALAVPTLHSPRENMTKDHSPSTSDALSSADAAAATEASDVSGGKVAPRKDTEPNKENVFIIGISGGSASGKTSVSERMIENLNVPWVVLISMDSFYKVLTKEQSLKAFSSEYNFDHPDAFDFPLLYATLKGLKKGRPIEIPIYDFTTHSRRKETQLIYGASVIIFEGILSFYDKSVRSLMDMKIFVDSDPDTRLARRLIRDISERGRDLKGILEQYSRHVKPAFEDFIQPTVRHADIIIPRGLDNTVAIDLITKHIARQLGERKIHFGESFLSLDSPKTNDAFPKGLIVLSPSNELKAIHTIIRDAKTRQDDFTFYIHRLSTLAIERALNELHYAPKSVTTPLDVCYHGLCFSTKDTMENALRKIARNVALGHMAIQSDPMTHEPKLETSTLPDDISSQHVLLMDITLATGTACALAIRTLLERSVPEEKIFLVTLIAAPNGIRETFKRFPKIKLITTEIDAELNDDLHILPGLGNFYQRYYVSDKGCN